MWTGGAQRLCIFPASWYHHHSSRPSAAHAVCPCCMPRLPSGLGTLFSLAAFGRGALPTDPPSRHVSRQMPGAFPGPFPQFASAFPVVPSAPTQPDPYAGQMATFWGQQHEEIRQLPPDPTVFRNHQLPLARIKKVRPERSTCHNTSSLTTIPLKGEGTRRRPAASTLGCGAHSRGLPLSCALCPPVLSPRVFTFSSGGCPTFDVRP